MLTEYCGNIKVGSLYTLMGNGIEGWTIYVADGDGNYNGIGDTDSNIWIQKVDFGGCEDENDKLFIKGVEFFDKYAEGDMWDKCSNALYWLSDNHVKSSPLYCETLRFFFELGSWDGNTKPLEYLKKVFDRHSSTANERSAFYYTSNTPFKTTPYEDGRPIKNRNMLVMDFCKGMMYYV